MRTRHLTIAMSALCAALVAGALYGCDGRPGSGLTGIVVPISGLSSLRLSAGTLAPTFNPNTGNYTASVPQATLSITVTPTAATNGSTILVNGNTVASGSASPAIPLTVGTNPIDVVVNGPPGAAQHSYRVVVTRQTT